MSQAAAFRLDQPMFIQVPRAAAAQILLACGVVALLMDCLISPSFGFTPIYLLICAFSAWFVGNRFAVMLYVLIASLQFLNSAIIARGPEVLILVNASLNFFTELAVILMLGVAREALEVEWRAARIDPLTGTLNRKAFFEAAKDEAGHGAMSVIAYADVDGLKNLNDKFGHQAGDLALRDFADRVRKFIRKQDIFARIGGDEFVILMAVRDSNAAKIIAERLNRILNLELGDGEHKLKCSLGVLVLTQGTKSIDDELRQADALMYLAKKKHFGLVMATAHDCSANITPLASDLDARVQQEELIRSIERKHKAKEGDGLTFGTKAA
jgi:diguanylate cyclase (GGDEF)-like protein